MDESTLIHQNEPRALGVSEQDDIAVEVRRLARRYVRRQSKVEGIDLEDVAQDVTLICLDKLRSGRMAHRPRFLKALVFRMVRNRLWDLSRRRKARFAREVRFADEGRERDHIWMSPDHGVELAELEALRDRVLEELPEMSRQVLVLLSANQSTYKAVGALLGLAPRAVCTHVEDARARLARMLIGSGVMALPRRTRRRSSRGPAR